MQVVPCGVLMSQLDYFLGVFTHTTQPASDKDGNTLNSEAITLNVTVVHEGYTQDEPPVWGRIDDTASISIAYRGNNSWLRVDHYHTSVSCQGFGCRAGKGYGSQLAHLLYESVRPLLVVFGACIADCCVTRCDFCASCAMKCLSHLSRMPCSCLSWRLAVI